MKKILIFLITTMLLLFTANAIDNIEHIEGFDRPNDPNGLGENWTQVYDDGVTNATISNNRFQFVQSGAETVMHYTGYDDLRGKNITRIELLFNFLASESSNNFAWQWGTYNDSLTKQVTAKYGIRCSSSGVNAFSCVNGTTSVIIYSGWSGFGVSIYWHNLTYDNIDVEKAQFEVIFDGVNYGIFNFTTQSPDNFDHFYMLNKHSGTPVIAYMDNLTFFSTCDENWIPYYTACTIGDNQTLLYNDTNNCNSPLGLPGDNGTISSCNYCTLAYHTEDTACIGNFEIITYPVYDNFGSCCNVTGIATDCDLPANTSVQCVGLHSSNDIPSVVIDTLVELGIQAVNYAPLILIVLGIGLLIALI